jgi:hypothetical protein
MAFENSELFKYRNILQEFSGSIKNQEIRESVI